MAPIPKEADYLVIGGGSGGLASGRRAASLYGAKVIVVESARLGGTCVNVGCVPKKVTWNAATIAETIHEASAYGFSVKQDKPFDWATFKEKRDAYVKRLNGIYAKNLDNDKVELIEGHAEFVSNSEVLVRADDGSEQLVKAKKILIAVGGYPTLPDIPGAELGITSDGFFELPTQPKKVAVVGAGYIAVEMAGMFNALGTETHLFIRGDTFLRTFDPMVQDKLTAEYERLGVHIHRQSSVTAAEKLDGDLKRITYTEGSSSDSKKTLDVDTILFSIGRSPNTSSLNLSKLSPNPKTNKKGHLIVDDYQNTNVSSIYALGDVCDRGFELTPVAIAAGRRLADRLFGGTEFSTAKLDYSCIPSVVFAHPECGTIGLTEPQAREQYKDQNIKIYNANFTAMWYSMMAPEQKAPTNFKLICVGDEERVVGLHILGLGAAEMLQGFGVAIKMGATKKDFDRCVAIHPTSAEELVTMK